jgi:RNA polymerase sigma-70 factor (ECF subfamily)
MIDGEEKLIKNAIKGEASAFGLLYDKYQPQIYRFVYLKVSHREEAEDLTHQIFLKAWQNMSDFNFRGFPFSSWLYRSARNQVIDYYRTKKSNIPLEDIVEIRIEDSRCSDNFEANLEIEKIKKTISRLNPGQQDVVILRFVEDFSVRETAEALNKSEIAVKLLQYRAIRNLKKLLDK